MHILHEVFAERDQEEYAEGASQKGAEEHLPEIDVQAQDVDGRKGENSSCDHHSGTGSDTLDDDVLSQSVFLAEYARYTDGYNGNRYCSFENLAYFKPQVGCGCREQNRHEQAHRHGVGRHLQWFPLRTQ